MKIEVKNSIKPVDYITSINFLEKRARDVFRGKKDELLWIVEHDHIYTAGTSSKKEDVLNKNIKVTKTGRGGKHTYHGPGQKVVYFVLNLNKRKKDIRSLLDKIENCIINILKDFKIKSYSDKKNIGIWVYHKKKKLKIAAIGIRVKRWVAFHGFALNVSNDLEKYKNIKPCGLNNNRVTSLKKLGIKNYDNINKVIIHNFLNIFL